jgi:hypothetical protein
MDGSWGIDENHMGQNVHVSMGICFKDSNHLGIEIHAKSLTNR